MRLRLGRTQLDEFQGKLGANVAKFSSEDDDASEHAPVHRLHRELLVDEFAALREDEVAPFRLAPFTGAQRCDKHTLWV